MSAPAHDPPHDPAPALELTIQPVLVRRVAELARLGLDDDELLRSAAQLAGILRHFEALQTVDTAGVPPLAHALDSSGVPAPDTVVPVPNARALLLPLTPHAREGFYVVPRVLDADFGVDAAPRGAGGESDPDPGAES